MLQNLQQEIFDNSRLQMLFMHKTLKLTHWYITEPQMDLIKSQFH